MNDGSCSAAARVWRLCTVRRNAPRSRRMAASRRLGRTYELTVASGIGRLVSHPNPIGSRCTNRDRSTWTSSHVPPGTFASRGSSANIGGKNRSKLSDGVSTTRPIRSGCRVMRIWVSAPPVSFATTVTSCKSSRSMNAAIRSATPGGVRSAPGIACSWEPSGQSTAYVWKPASTSPGTTWRQRSALTSKPWTNTATGPLEGPLSK